MNLTAIGGRRFLLTLGCGIVSSILVWHAKISDTVFATVIIATVGAYITGNTFQKVKESKEETKQGDQ